MEVERDTKDMESFILDTGQCVRITPRKKHRLTAVEDTTICEVSTPEIDDDYSRVGG